MQPLLDATAGVQPPTRSCGSRGRRAVDRQALDETLGRDFQRAETVQPAGDPGHPARRVRRADRRRGAGPAGALRGGRRDRAVRPRLPPGAGHATPRPASILLIGMAVGVDYSLFYLRREREERAKGRPRLDAVEIAAETSGHAVVVSGIAVIISMAGMFLANDVVFSSLAVGSILVVAVAVTRLADRAAGAAGQAGPLGRPAPGPGAVATHRAAHRRGRAAEPRFWPAVLRPRCAPAGSPWSSRSGAARAGRAGARHEAEVPRHGGPAPDHPGHAGLRPADRGLPEQRQRSHRGGPGAGRAGRPGPRRADRAGPRRPPPTRCSRRSTAGPQIEVSADRRVSALDVATPYASRDRRGGQSLDELRADLLPAALRGIPGVEYAVGGGVAGSDRLRRPHPREAAAA